MPTDSIPAASSPPPAYLTPEDERAAHLLNETILGAASRVNDAVIAPETTRDTAGITTWDELPELPGHPQGTSEMSIAEQLVTSGADEAGIEKQAAAGALE